MASDGFASDTHRHLVYATIGNFTLITGGSASGKTVLREWLISQMMRLNPDVTVRGYLPSEDLRFVLKQIDQKTIVYIDSTRYRYFDSKAFHRLLDVAYSVIVVDNCVPKLGQYARSRLGLFISCRNGGDLDDFQRSNEYFRLWFNMNDNVIVEKEDSLLRVTEIVTSLTDYHFLYHFRGGCFGVTRIDIGEVDEIEYITPQLDEEDQAKLALISRIDQIQEELSILKRLITPDVSHTNCRRCSPL